MSTSMRKMPRVLYFLRPLRPKVGRGTRLLPPLERLRACSIDSNSDDVLLGWERVARTQCAYLIALSLL